MEWRIIRAQFTLLLLTAAVAVGSLPAYADLISLDQKLTIQQTDSSLTISRDLDLQQRQTDEITRGNDLTRAVSDFIRKTKELLAHLKSRQADQIRGTELNRITNDNTKDAIWRNRMVQQAQQRSQKDQMQTLKARNRDLNQRIRDLSRR